MFTFGIASLEPDSSYENRAANISKNFDQMQMRALYSPR